MIKVHWTQSTGWCTPELAPYSDLTLSPSASVLHYATSCFEGMKAYRGYDGNLRLLRPRYNCARMLASATRACLPTFDPDELLKLIKALLSVDGEKWASVSQPGSILYIRPTLIGIGDDSLGLAVPTSAVLFVIMNAVPYSEPVSSDATRPTGKELCLRASEGDFIRAWPGGSGSYKLSANYGPSLLAHDKALREGCDQVLWLFGPEGTVTEAGFSNFFLVWKTQQGRVQMVTPKLEDGTILPGVTRRSVLDLSRSVFCDEVDVVEKDFTIHDLISASKEGRLLSVFAVGTACFISPVGKILFGKEVVDVDHARSEYVVRLQKAFTDIVLGREESAWVDVV